MVLEECFWKNLPSVRLRTRELEMILPVGFGPRVAFFGRPQSENLLFWDDSGEMGRGDWKLRGGHRVWVTRPQADECEETYRADNEPCTVKLEGGRVEILGALDPVSQIQKGLRVEIVQEDCLRVEHFLVNRSPLLYSAGIWALSCTRPTAKTSYAFPLGDGSEWDTFRTVIFRKWAGQPGRVQDPQFQWEEDQLLLHPRGIANKRMLEAPHGVMGMHVPESGLTFARQAEYHPGAEYPRGCNLAVYVGGDNFMVEMESMGPCQTLKPGGRLSHAEMWLLTGLLNQENALPLLAAFGKRL